MTGDKLGRRRTDVWLLRPDAPCWHYRGIAVVMACVAGVATFADVIWLGSASAEAANIVASVFGMAAFALLLTHHIVRRFSASMDAYFIGFQAGIEVGGKGEPDPAVVAERMRHHAETRLRSIPGQDPSAS